MNVNKAQYCTQSAKERIRKDVKKLDTKNDTEKNKICYAQQVRETETETEIETETATVSMTSNRVEIINISLQHSRIRIKQRLSVGNHERHTKSVITHLCDKQK